MISSLFVIPWRGLEPTSGSRAGGARTGSSRTGGSRSAEAKSTESKSAGARAAARKEQRPTLLVRDFIGDAGSAPLRVVFERFDESPHEFSPIVFYGPTATGKTHLAWLLAARAAALSKPTLAKSPTARGSAVKPNPVFWTSGAEFVRQVAHAIEADGIPDFRRRVQSAPAFILDGLDAVAGRGPAQAELLVLLDDCRRRDIPVVVTSSTMPLETPELQPAIASRLQAGLVVPLQPPGPAARQQLLNHFAAKLRFTIPPEWLRRIHERLDNAADARPTAPELYELVRELAKIATGEQDRDADDDDESAATPSSLAARAAAFRACIDKFADRWGARPSLSLRVVSQAVAEYFGLKPAELKGPSRRQMVVRARGVAIYLGRQLAGESLDRLGEHFGGRDHTTALHAVRKTEELLTEDPMLRKAVDDLLQRLQPE